MIEFTIFYATNLHMYGAKVRMPNGIDETWHQTSLTKLKELLAARGLWPSIQIPKLALEAGATIVINIPSKPIDAVTETTDLRPFELKVGLKT